MRDDLAGVVLAAGAGTRLRPLTGLRPKALVPVGGRPLLLGALDRLAPAVGRGPGAVAVNAHHHAEQVAAAADGRAHLSREEPEALGTAGALAALRGWLDGRAALVTNADAWMPDPRPALAALVDGWDGRRCRLLCAPVAPGARADLTSADGSGATYVGTCLLPASALAGLEVLPSGLYEVLWRAEAAAGRLDVLVVPGPVPQDAGSWQHPAGPRGQDPASCAAGTAASALPLAVDTGTVADYLRANLLASGGASVVGEGAVVEGTLERCVVWDGARVAPGEHLVDAVRAGTPDHPVTARPR